MRPITLGVVVLAVGTLLALPFRRDVAPPPSRSEDDGERTRRQILDDRSLQLLVEEVTQDVEIPTVFDPQTDYVAPKTASQDRRLPLSYDEVAVPVQGDPVYEQRFNATVEVASRVMHPGQSPLGAQNTEASENTLAKARRFNSKPAANPTVSQLLGKNFRPQAIQVPSLTDAKSTPALPAADRSREHSVLAPLPPPDDVTDEAETPREKHWIRQPD